MKESCAGKRGPEERLIRRNPRKRTETERADQVEAAHHGSQALNAPPPGRTGQTADADRQWWLPKAGCQRTLQEQQDRHQQACAAGCQHSGTPGRASIVCREYKHALLASGRSDRLTFDAHPESKPGEKPI
jgi:hypothetical protein